MFMTNDAKHEKPLISSIVFGTSVFTGSGNSDISPGSLDLFVVSNTCIFVHIYLNIQIPITATLLTRSSYS